MQYRCKQNAFWRLTDMTGQCNNEIITNIKRIWVEMNITVHWHHWPCCGLFVNPPVVSPTYGMCSNKVKWIMRVLKEHKETKIQSYFLCDCRFYLSFFQINWHDTKKRVQWSHPRVPGTKKSVWWHLLIPLFLNAPLFFAHFLHLFEKNTHKKS